MHGEVIRTERLSRSLIRVVLGGAGLASFAGSAFTDAYVNCLFLPDGSPLDVPWDEETARATAAEHRPRPRRLSVRRWDASSGELTLDIVSHGDVGHCGRWAGRARSGDLLQLRGPAGGYVPHPDADEYLFVGDESALPAIAASAEAVAAGKRVRIVALVDAPEDEIAVQSPGELEVVWIHRSVDSAVTARAMPSPPPARRRAASAPSCTARPRNRRRSSASSRAAGGAIPRCSPRHRTGGGGWAMRPGAASRATGCAPCETRRRRCSPRRADWSRSQQSSPRISRQYCPGVRIPAPLD